MYYPPLFKTNFTTSDGIDLGEKLISKNYLLSSYPNLLDSISASSLFTWGYNELTNNDSTTPVQVSSSSSFFGKVKQISSNKWQSNPIYYSGLIKSDGSLWVIGDNEYGQLGLNNTTNQSTFVQVVNSPDGNDYNWKQIYCGSYSTVAIKNDGTLWTCGYNINYQLGLNNNTTPVKKFTQVGSDRDWKYACIGQYHGLAIKENGSLYSWGTNRNGLLGQNSTSISAKSNTPNQIGTDTDWEYIDTSSYTSGAIKSDGSLYIWGNYDWKGRDGSNYYYRPTRIPGDTGSWKIISIGFTHASAIRSDGTLWSIGDNNYLALGTNNGSPSSSSSFLQIAIKGIWKQVACGNFFGAAIRSDGTLWTWGNTIDGQSGRGSSGQGTPPVPVGQVPGYWSQLCCQSFAVKAIKTYDYI